MGRMLKFDSRYLTFFDLWNARQYYECHETLEQVWLESHGKEKKFYQGLIMSSAAFFHLEKGNTSGCLNLLVGALNYLEQYPPRYLAFPVREFADLLATWQARVELMRAVQEIEFSPSQLPLIQPPTNATTAHLIP